MLFYEIYSNIKFDRQTNFDYEKSIKFSIIKIKKGSIYEKSYRSYEYGWTK
ncbi:hypothetical protein ALC152_18680 [Arcobacter sp. 15-2]